jgi:hypothetical protein
MSTTKQPLLDTPHCNGQDVYATISAEETIERLTCPGCYACRPAALGDPHDHLPEVGALDVEGIHGPDDDQP